MKQLLRRLALVILASCMPIAAHAQASDLFISEYIEGSSNNKAIEIYNGTGNAVNLATGGYNLQYFFNGSGTAGLTINLTGTVAAGDVYVIAQSSANAAILGQADLTNGAGWYNGDDAIVLRRGTTVLDVIGQVGSDPGTEWGTGLVSTADNSIVRKPEICAGDANGGDAFDPATQWNGFANDTVANLGSHTATCNASTTLSIEDNAGAEGDSGTRTLDVTVRLSAPAPEGGVSFTISDAGTGTATVGTDYQAFAPFSAGIAEGGDSYTFQVTFNGDTDDEPNESIVLTVSGIEGGVEADDLSAVATIQNDDAPITPINAIQGSGTASSMDGNVVTTEGVITVLRGNGFYIQSTAEFDDNNAATSDGLWVFTGGAPLPSLAVGDVVQVSGTVDEFQPVSFTYPVTELLPSSIVETGTAPLPTPVEVTAADFDAPLIEPDVLEHLEGMYVHIASGKIVAPTRSASTEFEIVVDGVARPIREAGISIFDTFPVPPEKAATIPYFDANQERIKLQPISGSTPLVDARGTVSDVYGALDYAGAADAVNSWKLWYDPTRAQLASGAPQAVNAAGADDVAIAGYNMEWFFVNGMDGQSGTEAQRRSKITAVICDWLKTPDILATEEVDDLATLQDLAAQVNGQCPGAPAYEAHMLYTDADGAISESGPSQQRLGFLISKRIVRGTTPRVELVEIQQHNVNTLLKDANGNDIAGDPLNDRPPLRLKAVVHFADGRRYPVTVIAVHQKSLIAVDSTAAGNDGYPTVGARNRAKRAQQAVQLAQLVDDVQTGAIGGNPNEKIVLVGDFNSFDANDGYVDVMGISTGHPAPESQVVLHADSPLSEANGGTPLIVGNELIADPEERYSYIFGNISQTLDHTVINQALLDDPGISDIAVDHARVNADFRPSFKNVYHTSYNTSTQPPLGSSDHDPVRLRIELKPDTTPPTLAPTLPGLILQGGTYVVAPNATDENGIASASCAPSPLDTSSAGTKSVTCSATDLAGNTASVTLKYKVISAQFQWQQPLLPVLYSVNANQRVLLQWRLVNTLGGWVDNLSSATVTSVPIACPSSYAVDLPAYTGSAIELEHLYSGIYRKTWNVTAGQPQALRTLSGPSGSCLRMNLDVGDGKPHTVLFKLK